MASNLVQWIVDMDPDISSIKAQISENSYKQLLAPVHPCVTTPVAPVVDLKFLPKLTDYAQSMDPDDPDQMVTQDALGFTLRRFLECEVTPLREQLTDLSNSIPHEDHMYHVRGDHLVDGQQTVMGASVLKSSLTVGSPVSPQPSTLNGPTTINGHLAIQGPLQVGTAAAPQPTSLHGPLSVDGAHTVGGPLVVGTSAAPKATTLNGSLAVGSSELPQTTTLHGTTQIATGAFHVGNDVQTDFYGPVTAHQGATIQGGAFTVGSSTASQPAAFHGPTSILGGELNVGSASAPQNTTLVGALSVHGASTLHAGLTVGSSSSPQPSALNGPLSVAGGSTSLQGGGLTVGSTTAPQTTTLNGSLLVAGGESANVTATGVLNLAAPIVNVGAAGGKVNLLGASSHVSSSETDISQRNINLNTGSGAGTGTSYLPVSSSAYGAGVTVEENNEVVAYAALSTDGKAWQFAVPLGNGDVMRMDQSIGKLDTPRFPSMYTTSLPVNACVFTDANQRMSAVQLGAHEVLLGNGAGVAPTPRILKNGKNGIKTKVNGNDVVVDLDKTSTPLVAGIRLGSQSAAMTMVPPANLATNVTYTLPTPTAATAQFLTVDASNKMAWSVLPSQIPNTTVSGHILVSNGNGTGATWEAPPVPMPTTNTAGLVLQSTGNGAGWVSLPSPIPIGGVSGQVLQSTGGTGVAWANQSLNATDSATGFTTGFAAPSLSASIPRYMLPNQAPTRANQVMATADPASGTLLWVNAATDEQLASIQANSSAITALQNSVATIQTNNSSAITALQNSVVSLQTTINNLLANFVPGAPTVTSVTSGNATVTIHFTVPASPGASPIIAYLVKANSSTEVLAATIEFADGNGQATLTGLTNGVSYTFTITATNSYGAGPASLASEPVTPIGPIPLLPAPDITFDEVFTAGRSIGALADKGNNGIDGTHYLVEVWYEGTPDPWTVEGAVPAASLRWLKQGTEFSYTFGPILPPAGQNNVTIWLWMTICVSDAEGHVLSERAPKRASSWSFLYN